MGDISLLLISSGPFLEIDLVYPREEGAYSLLMMGFCYLHYAAFFVFPSLYFFSFSVSLMKGWFSSSGHPNLFLGSLLSNPLRKCLN